MRLFRAVLAAAACLALLAPAVMWGRHKAGSAPAAQAAAGPDMPGVPDPASTVEDPETTRKGSMTALTIAVAAVGAQSGVSKLAVAASNGRASRDRAPVAPPANAVTQPHARPVQVAVPLFAPYMYMSTAGVPMLEQAAASGRLKAFSAAFVVGNGCTPVWDDHKPVAGHPVNTKLAGARALGMTPIASFGGGASTELATTCTDVAKLTQAYQSVITTLQVARVDFDIEGVTLTDTAASSRRFAAIATLKQNNPGLYVTYTLPVLPTGLAASGKAFVRASAAAGIRPQLVNVMAMDYHGNWDIPKPDMGAYAISAARGTMAFLREIFPDATYGMVGITPMIGQNIPAPEVFTLADAQELVAFARDNRVGLLSFWSLGRDQVCPNASSSLGSCSRLTQQPLQFTRLFAG